MDAFKLEELKELGCKGDVNNVKPVLQCKAYHYNDNSNDYSMGILSINALLEKEDLLAYYDISIIQVLVIAYLILKLGPKDILGFSYVRLALHLSFNGSLIEQQIKDSVLLIINNLLEKEKFLDTAEA